jgi:hypothetical protein
MAYPQSIEIFQSLNRGDRIEVKHEVKVGFRAWETTTVGTVVRAERRRHGLHFDRNHDDKVFRAVSAQPAKRIRCASVHRTSWDEERADV